LNDNVPLEDVLDVVAVSLPEFSDVADMEVIGEPHPFPTVIEYG